MVETKTSASPNGLARATEDPFPTEEDVALWHGGVYLLASETRMMERARPLRKEFHVWVEHGQPLAIGPRQENDMQLRELLHCFDEPL